ncbi:MAG TPA: hypothetical protein DCL54_02650 [Alphaproteobacteria bacterium]|nr:hypothetical protein [Alphaproteobacteria bacterium]HAJ45463.1 hypothetical protein [Alphaproteobacteria bacterium]
MIDIRPFATLGTMRNDWLNAHYHFSFANYADPKRMNWGALRVWNDDTIKPGTGFERHGHRDMEIITYVRKGAITHRDHLGNEGRTLAGDVQVMSAGTGILHEEHNLEGEETQIFQLWIVPNQTGVKPGWASAQFPKDNRAGRLVTLASGHDHAIKAGALPIHQDAEVLGATITQGQELSHALNPKRFQYLVLAAGEVSVNGHRIAARDGMAIAAEPEVTIKGIAPGSELLLVDVPGV